MAGRLSKKPLIAVCLFLFVLFSGGAEAGLLASYSFDGDRLDTGPDTVRVFENSRGSVRLNADFRYSGYYSIEIRDVANDGDFPELQGYFPIQETGELHVHFAFMTPEPSERFNIALAGPEHFRLGQDGIGFWMRNSNADFIHVSDSIPKRLRTIEAFTWYLVDLTYRIDAGKYDLSIRREYDSESLIDIRDAPNAASAPGSRVNLFSFIGDLGDKSDAVYYVDDIEIRSDRLQAARLVAPGRRKLFIDAWLEIQRDAREKPQCLPGITMEDFGIDTQDLVEMADAGTLDRLKQLLETPQGAITQGLIEDLPGDLKLRSVARWKRACDQLQNDGELAALETFSELHEQVPSARIYALSEVLALAAVERFDTIDAKLLLLHDSWNDDMRLAAAMAMIALARGEEYSGEAVLALALQQTRGFLKLPDSAELWNSQPGSTLVGRLRGSYPDQWEGMLRNRLLLEQYYYLLLWRGEYARAYDFALLVASDLVSAGRKPGIWNELIGNALFFAGDYELALHYYETAFAQSGNRSQLRHSVSLKLSDLYFRLGDPEKERHFREAVYGSIVAGGVGQ